MSGFKAKYHAQQILQRLAAGEPVPPRTHQNVSPRKPGIRTADEILKEKYAELAKLMAVQQMEKQAVSALKDLYLTPRKRGRKSKRKSKDDRRHTESESEKSRTKSRRLRSDGERNTRKHRPQSASSTSSYSSTASASSAASSRSASSGSSAQSKSSASSSSSGRRKERTFVTIIEEEEEEEVINQDEIKERQIAKFDAELARENEEEARCKREASKHIRRVSFVLEAEEEEEEEDHVDLEDDLEIKEEEESYKHDEDFEQNSEHDYIDQTPTYIEVGNDLLREILRSPRSPRTKVKSSPGDDFSPRRRRKINKSPRRAWESFDAIPMPPRPKKDITPSDHKLSNSDNPEIRKWLKHKNALIRRQKRAESKKEREERLMAESAIRQKMERRNESEKSFENWNTKKRKVLLSQRKTEKRLRIETEKRKEMERAHREELARQRKSISSFGDKVPTPCKENRKKRKCKVKKNVDDVEPNLGGTHHSHRFSASDKNQSANEKEKQTLNRPRFPSSNPFKGLSYDDWMRQKLVDEERKKREKRRQKSDNDLEKVIPNLAKERIERAKNGKGKKVDSGLKSNRDDRPECDQPSQSKDTGPKPYTWQSSGMGPHPLMNQPGNKRGEYKTVPRPPSGKKRPSSGQRHQKVPAGPSNSNRARRSHVFSPLFARPEPQGSESNDDHSEHSVKVPGKDRSIDFKKEDRDINKSQSQSKNVEEKSDLVIDPNQLTVFMTEFGE